jgi:competence protein ComEA
MTPLKSWQQSALIFLAGVAFTAVGFIISSPPRGKPVVLTPVSPVSIVVHLDGAVRQPGVYTLPAGSRIQDAVEMAGGFTTDARMDTLNLAKRMQDGYKITIPSKQEIQSTPIDDLLDINQATLAELDQLPGIGETRAQSIIDYRSEHGLFTSVDDLQEVPGISADVFSNIRELVIIR